MIEDSRLGSARDAVDASASLKDIAKYAYDKRSVLGEDYALMMVMTGYDLCSGSSTCSRCKTKLYNNIVISHDSVIAQWENKGISLSILPVARVQFPATAEYFKGYFRG